MKFVLTCVLALALPAGAAQLYKWTDEKGNVEWRDTPPPANAKKVEQRNMGGNTIETSTMPYALQQAVKNHPVTLWGFDCGPPCGDARKHLAKRGIPYTERDSQKNAEAFRKLTGSLEVPVLYVGSRKLTGYLASAWDAALDSAGYPSSPVPGYKAQVRKDDGDAKQASKDTAAARK